MAIRVGIIIGCDDDAVEDKKYVGNLDVLKDLPHRYRIDPKSHQYLNLCPKGAKGIAHADVAIGWLLGSQNADIKVDLIPPDEITMKRLKSNDFVFPMGYDIVNSAFEGAKAHKRMQKLFAECGNIIPQYPFQEHIYFKSRYLKACQEQGVPIAPSFFVAPKPSVSRVIDQIKERGWKTFVIKQSMSAFASGFLKASTEDVCRKPQILEKYFEDFPNAPEFIFQEAIPGFRTNWETRVFWWKGEFLYAIANKAAVMSPTGKEIIVTGNDIPPHFLKEAKRVGKQVIDTLPPLLSPGGKPMEMCTLIRTDIGCSDTKLDDKDYDWKANKKTFFLNELEFGSINLFVRHLKFDAIPLWAQKMADGCREIAAADASKRAGAKRSRSSSVTPETTAKKARSVARKAAISGA